MDKVPGCFPTHFFIYKEHISDKYTDLYGCNLQSNGSVTKVNTNHRDTSVDNVKEASSSFSHNGSRIIFLNGLT